jgi:hypothetical protein
LNSANRHAWFKPGGNAMGLVSVVDIFSAANIKIARAAGEQEKVLRLPSPLGEGVAPSKESEKKKTAGATSRSGSFQFFFF